MNVFLDAKDTECASPTPGRKGCSCGSKVKSRDQLSCKEEEAEASRCPCVRRGEQCNETCKCRHCDNNKIGLKEKDAHGCKCGEERKSKDPSFVSSVDVKGKKLTRCPCYVNKARCCDTCKCYNCGNTFGTRNTENIKEIPQVKRKKILSSPPSSKRRRGTHYANESNLPEVNGGWTQFETCILQMTVSFVYATSVLHTQENIHQLYNFVVKSNTARLLQITPSVKSRVQITGKLLYIKKRQEEIRRLNFRIHAVL